MRRRLFTVLSASSLLLLVAMLFALLWSQRPSAPSYLWTSRGHLYIVGLFQGHAWMSRINGVPGDLSVHWMRTPRAFSFTLPNGYVQGGWLPGWGWSSGTAQFLHWNDQIPAWPPWTRFSGQYDTWVMMLWVPIALTAILPASWIVAARAKHIRRVQCPRRGQCSGCGYDLRATPGRCPECGAAASRTMPRT